MSSAHFNRLSSSYFWYFSVLGLFIPFLAVFLDSKGFSSLQIGEILGLITATKIVGPALWASIADKKGHQLSIIRLGALLALVCFSFLFLMESYWGITFILAIFSLFWTAILPQLEVFTLKSIRHKAKIYGRIRLWGSIGFTIVAFFGGELITRWPSNGFIISGLLILLALYISTLRIRPIKIPATRIANHTSIKDKILHWNFVSFFLAGVLLQISFGPYYHFFALYLRDAEYSGFVIGSVISLAVIAEVGIFIFAGRLFKRFNVRSLLCFSLLITAFRWYITGRYVDNLTLLILAQFIHAASYGIYHSASMAYIYQHFNANQQSRGQALYIGGGYGIGGALGAYIAGALWLDGQGAQNAFDFAAVIAIVGAVFALCVGKKQASPKKT